MSSVYPPEIDISQELAGADTSYFYLLISVLRWMVGLGCADISTEVLKTSSHLALTCKGHTKELYHIFVYLKKHHNDKMIFDPNPCDFDETLFDHKVRTYSAY